RGIHADPHPGNYLIADDGIVELVDFGCVKQFSPAFVEMMRGFEERIWMRGEEPTRRFAAMIWGQEILKRPQVAKKLLKQAVEFYELLFPAVTGKSTPVNFGDAKVLETMFGIWNDCLRSKAVNPEFAFHSRAE